jgi:hypothetical protein
MKLELDVALEGIIESPDGEEYSYSIEDHLRHDIIQRVIERIFNAVKDNYEKQINDIIEKKVAELTEKTFSDFLVREISVTDTYGSVKWSGTVEELIKRKFDEWLLGTVDEKGRSATSHYDKLQKRVNFLITTQLEKHSNEFVQRAVTEVADKLEKTLSEDFRDIIGKKIADKIGLNKLLPKMLKK